MRPSLRWLFPVLFASLALAVPASADYSVSKAYVGGASDQAVLWCADHLNPALPGVNGDCFPLNGAETSAQVTIADRTGLPVAASLFVIRGGHVAVHTDMCGSATVSIPAGSTKLELWMGSDPGGASFCVGQVGQPTTGTITVNFTAP